MHSLKRIFLLTGLLLMPVIAIVSAEKLQVNPEAQQKAISDARQLVPDTIDWDFSDVKEIYLDEFAIINDFEDGMLGVQDVVTGKCGFMNEDGEWVIPMSLFLFNRTYNENVHFCNGYCVCDMRNANGKSDLIILDKKGKIVKLPNITRCTDFTADGYALVEKKVVNDKGETRYKPMFINPQGQEIMKGIYSGKTYRDPVKKDFFGAYDLSDGLAPFCDFSTGLWGFFDKDGNKVIPAKYNSVCFFSEGLAAVQLSKNSETPLKWGYIDVTGKMVIPARFSNMPGSFNSGLATVLKTNERFVYIDKTGKVVTGEYDRVEPFYHGYAFVQDVDHYDNYCVNTDFEIVNINENCLLLEEDYLWNGRKESWYNTSLGTFDFIGRHVIVKGWQYKQYQGDGGRLGDFKITGGTMLCAMNDTLLGDPARYAFFADLTGKVKFVLLRNEF